MSHESKRRLEAHAAKLSPFLAGLLVHLAGCGEGGRSQQNIAQRQVTAKAEVSATSIVETLAGRRTWPSSGVKIWLRNPTVVITCKNGDGNSAILHAWDGNENDFGVPMARINSGDTLYQLTQEEFGVLSRINENTSRPP